MYDIGIIGGGPGGYSAAFEAAKNGLKVVLFESDRLGGTCLNRGCIPTKYMAHIADICSKTGFGMKPFFGESSIDFNLVQKRKSMIVGSLQKNLEDSLCRSKIKIIYGKAFIKEAGCILCKSEEYFVKAILIATGATAKQPFAEGFLNSDNVLKLERLPKSMKIVGGETIAVEFAQIFCRLGVEVKLQIRSERLLRKWNREAALSVTKLLKDEGIRIESKCDIEALKKLDAEVCLSATGVQPLLPSSNSDLFETGASGGIIVDRYGKTRTDGIYAVGDVTENSTQLAHHAMEEGRRAVRHILGQEIPPAPCIVKCIYTSPEIAEAGYTEETAREKNISYVTVKIPLYSNSMNMIFGGKRGYIRLLADSEKGTLIGAQIMCERASDLIAELALAINTEVPIRKCMDSVRLHPSFSEGISDAFSALWEKIR